MRSEVSIRRAVEQLGLMGREIARLEAVRGSLGERERATVDRRIDALASMRWQLIRDVGLGMTTSA